MNKLIPELIPLSSFFSNLRSVLTATEWKKLKQTVYEKFKYRCSICGGVGREYPVECHEIWEYDEDTSIQKLVGLTALCPACHRVKHIGLTIERRDLPRSVQHLCRVNHIDQDQAEQIVRDALDLWNKRSAIKWELDLSLVTDKKPRVGPKRTAIK